MKSDSARLKLFKVRRKGSFQAHGIAVRSFSECVKKGCSTLKIKPSDFTRIMLVDGTHIDDEEYLMSLKPNTTIIFESRSDNGSPIRKITDLLNSSRMDPKITSELLKLAKSETDKMNRSILITMMRQLDSNVDAETREDDPNWFQRVADKKVRTKSEVLESSAMNRVRSYLYEAKSHIKEASLNAHQKSLAADIIDKWWSELKTKSMFKYYFSRVRRQSYTFCDENGWFSCEGDYQSPSCESLHSINPYSSSEQRAIFSQWNLDHQIEKSRTVLPRVIELIRSTKSSKVNWEYFFKLMFTRDNLKLVHIACHIKQEHVEATIDDSRVFC